ncbi:MULTISPECIES: DUF2235 domain-containing protein [Rhizobium/Agrobacterium group]|uniref:DUF2235 domain-containing protein n=1 Tax=Rhizobium/Agrobacterium group TaxID=227290 RepID=UPI00230047BB|nr:MULTISPECIES: DUF2235 domain-containing protein [Rhizobium/Agrobacterium group]MDA5633411.1 DUF2235 domain-containing protein [Agrobacterium sp. ST15.16.024]MDF1889055.1 DUF2235 domain-containing protein [Rhizobium rhizogenes]
MPKNILILSDGTGQAGGLLPDERRSNVYKLFRATRCGPDSAVNPDDQIAFYDAGLGSASDADDIKIGAFRKIYNVLSQATGLGITKNIVDCYTFVLQSWEPGDRIFLFGFSRGAYTARCLGGVLGWCGVPTTMDDGVTVFYRDPKTARKVANEAVKTVYQHGAGKGSKLLDAQRKELAARFREKYRSSDETDRANTVPYFVGVWDTVGALGVNAVQQILILLALTLGVAGLATAVWAMMPWQIALNVWLFASVGVAVTFMVAWYLATHLKWATGLSDPWWKTIHLTGWRMKFYDTVLNPRVEYAKHALSIDENRAKFARVPWTDESSDSANKEDGWFEQVWFAGVHSDIGGSYLETESRLSDIALAWMVNRATNVTHPIVVDDKWLHLYPSSAGVQHDEIKSGWLPWKSCVRKIPVDAPIHPSVVDRFKLAGVVHYDETKAYRPEGLRGHDAVKSYYDGGAAPDPEAGSAIARM